jgi:hypothetical protein
MQLTTTPSAGAKGKATAGGSIPKQAPLTDNSPKIKTLLKLDNPIVVVELVSEETKSKLVDHAIKVTYNKCTFPWIFY